MGLFLDGCGAVFFVISLCTYVQENCKMKSISNFKNICDMILNFFIRVTSVMNGDQLFFSLSKGRFLSLGFGVLGTLGPYPTVQMVLTADRLLFRRCTHFKLENDVAIPQLRTCACVRS